MALQAVVDRPLDALQQRLVAATSAGSDPSEMPADWGFKEELQAALDAEGGTAAVPVLNASSFNGGALKNHTLVRFRGMVQDMLEPEYYTSCYCAPGGRRLNSSFADVFSLGNGDKDSETLWEEEATKDRLPLYCVPVPTDNAWAALFTPKSSLTPTTESGSAVAPAKGKRDLNECGSDGEGASSADCNVDSEAAAAKKPFVAPAVSAVLPVSSGSSTPFGGSEELSVLVKLYDADVEGGGVKLNEVVEFIGVLEADPSADFNAQAARDGAAFGMSESELAALCPPSSRVPRLHCLLHRRLSATDEVLEYAAAKADVGGGQSDDGLISTSAAAHCSLSTAGAAGSVTSAAALTAASPTAGDLAPAATGGTLPRGRALALGALTTALGGDELAAEYVLLVACAKVVARVDGLPLGCLPLHLSLPASDGGVNESISPANMRDDDDGGFEGSLTSARDSNDKDPIVEALAKCVANLWPRCRWLALTEEKLRSDGLLPRKDYATNRLQTSPLQLAAHTVLVVDETRLDSEAVAAALADVEGAPGGGSGVTDDDDHGYGTAMASSSSEEAAGNGGTDARMRRSLVGLRELCQTQELGYDFQFYSMKFKADHPILLCSRRRSSSSYMSSEGTSQQERSLVDPSACVLPVVFNSAAASAATSAVRGGKGILGDADANDLVEARHYIATVAARPPAPFAPGLDKIAEEDFVRLRQSGQPSSGAAPGGDGGGGVEAKKEDVSAADFHRWLTLARLICASCGETTVHVAHWQRALALEAARVARLPARPLPPPPLPAPAASATNTATLAGMAGGAVAPSFASPAAARTHATNSAMGPPPPPPLGAPKQMHGGVANDSPSSSAVGAPRTLPVNMEGEEE